MISSSVCSRILAGFTAAVALSLSWACSDTDSSSALGPPLETVADRTLAPGQLSFYGQGGLNQNHPLTPCLGDGPYRDFDFWVATFNVTGPSGAQAGTNRIESILDGCGGHQRDTQHAAGSGAAGHPDARPRRVRRLPGDRSRTNADRGVCHRT